MRSTKLVLRDLTTSKQKSITNGVKNIQHDMEVVVITQLEWKDHPNQILIQEIM